MTHAAHISEPSKASDLAKIYEDDLLGFIIESILAGHELSCSGEKLTAGGLDDQPFCHSHPAFPEWSNPVYRSRAWAAERLIWLSLNQRENLCQFIDSTVRHVDIDEESHEKLIERLHRENAERVALCSVELTERHIGEIFVASLQSGYRLTWDSTPEFWCRWRYDNNRFLQEQGINSDWERPTVTSKNNRAAAINFFASHYDIEDGAVVTSKRHGLPDLWFALTHLGFRTIREFIVDAAQ